MSAIALTGPVQAQSVLNGSMTGDPTIGSPPPGWNSLNTDGDTVGPGGLGIWAPGISASPDGGTFLMVLDNGSGGSFDRCGQVISGFTVGQTYRVTFFCANGALDFSSPYNGPLTVEVGMFGGSQATDTLAFDGFGQQKWYTRSFDFQANDVMTELTFRANSLQPGSGAAAAVDGVMLTVVPSPGTFTLLAAGGVMMWPRRRKSVFGK